MATKPAAEKNACALGGTKYCRLLNMRSCESCTVRDAKNIQQVREDLELYETLLPEGGVARLFLSQECQFCRREPKGRRHGYAILDMAHPEPRRLQRRMLLNRTAEFGTMIPLQFAICPRCRRRFLWIEYSTIVFPVAFGLLGLGLLAVDAIKDTLSAWASIAPFLLWLGILAVGALIGTLCSSGARKRYKREMFSEVYDHPTVRAMMRLGWTPIAKQSRTKLLFSKSRLARGLGTAPDESQD